MGKYLIYETEQREIRIAEISSFRIAEIKMNHMQNMSLYPQHYLDDFKVSLYIDRDIDNLMEFFEIHKSIPDKYIKHDLSVYDEEKRLTTRLYGCFPSEVDYLNMDGRIQITFSFDHKEIDYENKIDESTIKIYNRDKKLESIGI